MRSIVMVCFSATLAALFLPGLVFAATTSTAVVVVNETGVALNVQVAQQPEVLPGLSKQFTLDNNQAVVTPVVMKDGHHEGYIHTNPLTDPNAYTYFGVSTNGYMATVHGYLDHAVAYSWTNGPVAVVKLCTPDRYKIFGHC